MPDGGRLIFLGVLGAPYESELTTTLLRLVNEAIAQGHRVAVYTCGGATELTLKTLGDKKPANFLERGTSGQPTRYPTTAQLIRELLEMAQGRLQWYVCRPCMEERGALSQIEGVIKHVPPKLRQLLGEADVALLMGVK